MVRFIASFEDDSRAKTVDVKVRKAFLNYYPECTSSRNTNGLLVGRCVLRRISPIRLNVMIFLCNKDVLISKHIQHQSSCDPHWLDSSVGSKLKVMKWLTVWFGHVTRAFSSIRINNYSTIRPEWKLMGYYCHLWTRRSVRCCWWFCERAVWSLWLVERFCVVLSYWSKY